MKTKAVSFVMLFLWLLFQSCSPRATTKLPDQAPPQSPISKVEEVLVLDVGEEIPEHSSYIGELKVGDTGFTTECSYVEVIKIAKIMAKQSGANLISIRVLKAPNFRTPCYRIKAEMYQNEDQMVLNKIKKTNELKNESRLSEEEEYAIIHFYRPKRYPGALVGYKVWLEDEKIGRVRNGEKFEYKVTDFGKKTFWAKTETLTSVEVDVKKGEEYFVRCGLNMGLVVGRPDLDLTENKIGVLEYEEMK